MAEISTRLLRNLRRLRLAFFDEMKGTGFPFLYHALIGFKDNLSAYDIFGPGSPVRSNPPDETRLAVPDLGDLHVLTFESLAVLESPQWTDLGQKLHLDPMTFNMLSEARERLIASPGTIAQGFLLTDDPNSTTERCCKRLDTLANDAMECIFQLRMFLEKPSLGEILNMVCNHNKGTWFRLIHQLAWSMNGGLDSLLRATRHTWVKGIPSFLPHDGRKLRRLLASPLFAGQPIEVTVPPDRFISVLRHDAFTASAYALDDLLYLAENANLSNSKENEDNAQSDQNDVATRDKVFISYCHKDEKWRNDLCTMLAPAIRNRIVNVWHDKQNKTGGTWRTEIDTALRSARIGVLLVTMDFLASDFINDVEMKYLFDAARTQMVKLIWVAVRHCMYEHTPLESVLAVNDPAKPLDSLKGAKRDKAIKEVCEQIVEQYGGKKV